MYRNCLTGLTLVAMMTGALPVLAQESATKRVVIDTTAGAANAPQTPTCGRRGTAAWMGGEAAASVISGAAAPFGQTISISGSDETLVLFRVENEATTVRVEVNADEAPTGDPVLRLFNSAGGLIDESDDYGSSLNSRIEANLEPGDYCASIASVGSDGFDAKVQIGLEAHPAIVSEGAASGIAAKG